MLHHYITKYIDENGNYIVEAWLQFNFFKWCFCFSRRKKLIKKAATLQSDCQQYYFLIQTLPGLDVGGNLSPGPIVAP